MDDAAVFVIAGVSCSAAWARSKALIGSRRHATTKEAKGGESGQPLN